jgi:peptidoglycan hydrolase CwlO-like protein
MKKIIKWSVGILGLIGIIMVNVFIPATTIFSVLACLGYVIYIHRNVKALYTETQLNVEFIESHEKAIKQIGENQKILAKTLKDIRASFNKTFKQNIENKKIDSLPEM